MNNDIKHLKTTIEVAKESVKSGNHPFGAMLVGPNGEVLITSGNTYKEDKGVGHAEANVARAASQQYDPEFLEQCTLITSVEPCCMCAGSVYWAGIGSVVFGLTEKRLAEMTGDNPENLTLDLACRDVFAAGQRKVDVRGPYVELEDAIAADHIGFW
ncbi:nucleoside deaminase [Marinobacterium sp. YM272]|uniref:nucleoside deaminase n=1 Tax=Marinobacterium sp. YM272 TaxID=3421654 RepID=UPI003D7FD946